MNAITAEGLVKVYRSRKNEVRALDGVDLEVPEGTILGLLGPNGAGKTTLIGLLLGLQRPTSGRVEVLGLDPTTHGSRLRPLVGYSPQLQVLPPDVPAEDQGPVVEAVAEEPVVVAAPVTRVDELALRRQRRLTRVLSLAVAAALVVALGLGGWVVSRFGARPPADAELAARLARYPLDSAPADRGLAGAGL